MGTEDVFSLTSLPVTFTHQRFLRAEAKISGTLQQNYAFPSLSIFQTYFKIPAFLKNPVIDLKTPRALLSFSEINRKFPGGTNVLEQSPALFLIQAHNPAPLRCWMLMGAPVGVQTPRLPTHQFLSIIVLNGNINNYYICLRVTSHWHFRL